MWTLREFVTIEEKSERFGVRRDVVARQTRALRDYTTTNTNANATKLIGGVDFVHRLERLTTFSSSSLTASPPTGMILRCGYTMRCSPGAIS